MQILAKKSDPISYLILLDHLINYLAKLIIHEIVYVIVRTETLEQIKYVYK